MVEARKSGFRTIGPITLLKPNVFFFNFLQESDPIEILDSETKDMLKMMKFESDVVVFPPGNA